MKGYGHIVMVLPLLLTVFAGLGGTAIAAGKSMVIALPTWSGYGPLYLARDKGFFEKYGLDVELSVTQDLSTRKQPFAGRRVDALATALDV